MVTEGSFLVSLDVSVLFTDFSIVKVIQLVKHFLNNTNLHEADILQLVGSLRMCLMKSTRSKLMGWRWAQQYPFALTEIFMNYIKT